MVVASVRLQLVFKPSSNVESLVGAKKRISPAGTQCYFLSTSACLLVHGRV